MDMPKMTAEQGRAGTYQLTSTYGLDEHITAEHWYCLPIAAIRREVRVGDMAHVRFIVLEMESNHVGRICKTKQGLAVHVEITGWRLPLSEVDVLGLVVGTAQDFRH